jgi:hypothetical protein
MTDDTTIVTVAQAIHAASMHAGMPLGHCDCAKVATVAVEAARVALAAEVESDGWKSAARIARGA